MMTVVAHHILVETGSVAQIWVHAQQVGVTGNL